MSASRKKLELLALILFEDEIQSWPLAGLIECVKDMAEALEGSRSERSKTFKRLIDQALVTAALDHGILGELESSTTTNLPEQPHEHHT